MYKRQGQYPCFTQFQITLIFAESGRFSYTDGNKKFVEECDALAEKHGERFRPNALLREMAAKGQTFYSRFPPKDQKAAAA